MLRDTFNKRIVQCLYAENYKTLLRGMKEDVINGEISYVYRLEYMLLRCQFSWNWFVYSVQPQS